MQKAEASVITETIASGFGEFTERKYIQGKMLGKGGFAKCFELTCEDNGISQAAKVIPKASLTKTRQRQKVK